MRGNKKSHSVAIFTVINGFEEGQPSLDVYSRRSVEAAVQIYRNLRADGQDCRLVLTTPEMPGPGGKFQHIAADEYAQKLGMPMEHIEFAPMINRNALEDVASAAEYCNEWFAKTCIVFYAPEVSPYFRVVCWATKLWFGYWRWKYSTHVARETPPAIQKDAKTYKLAWLLTLVSATTPWGYWVWKAFRHEHESGRTKDWSRSLHDQKS